MLAPVLIALQLSSQAVAPDAPAEVGFVAVTCQPSACKVFVDDVLIGITPIGGAAVKAGRHRIKLEDTATGLRLYKEVVVEANKSIAIDEKTKAAPTTPTPPTTPTTPPTTTPPTTTPPTPTPTPTPQTPTPPTTRPAAPPTTPTTPSTPSTPTTTTTPLPPTRPVPVLLTGAGPEVEANHLSFLMALEGRLSVGQAASVDEQAALRTLLTSSSAPRARALAAAVYPWLDPAVAAPALLEAVRDADATVRATATQSLVALARRIPDDGRPALVAAAVSLLDDVDDEAACAAAELLAATDPQALQDAVGARAAAAGDIRYACYSRVAGLPVRSVKLPELPPEPPSETPAPGEPPPPAPTPSSSEPGPNWVFLATAAGAGLLAGGAIPSGIVPSRDVLVYNADSTRLVREEVSFGTTAVAALAGAAALGGAAYGLELGLGRLSATEATSTAGATGAGAVLGAGLGLMLGTDTAGQSFALAGGTVGALAAGTAYVYAVDVDDNDNALMASAMLMGGLASGLGTFAAVPVGLTKVGEAARSDFGLSAGLTGAGVFGLVALGAAPVVDVPAGRAAAATAGGLLGAGLLTGVGFLVISPDQVDVASRIATGLGLSGQVVGMTLAYLFVPEGWVSAGGAVVDVNAKEARLGLPTAVVYAPLPGQKQAPVGVTLLRGSF